ncbi:hypothetical protein FACS1894155_02200 [Bacteroidia bacterium]|nr:hypothetical protein FACS1894155_02200 [Bacteroidia bacterium]
MIPHGIIYFNPNHFFPVALFGKIQININRKIITSCDKYSEDLDFTAINANFVFDMKREILDKLEIWKNSSNRKPLILNHYL